MKKLLFLVCLLPCFIQAESPELDDESIRIIGSIMLYPLTFTELKPDEIKQIIDETIRDYRSQDNLKTLDRLRYTLELYKSDKEERIKRLVSNGIPQEEAIKFIDHSIESLENLIKLVSIGFPFEVARKIVELIPESIPYIMSKPTGMGPEGIPLSNEYLDKFKEPITGIKI